MDFVSSVESIRQAAGLNSQVKDGWRIADARAQAQKLGVPCAWRRRHGNVEMARLGVEGAHEPTIAESDGRLQALVAYHCRGRAGGSLLSGTAASSDFAW